MLHCAMIKPLKLSNRKRNDASFGLKTNHQVLTMKDLLSSRNSSYSCVI